MAKDEATDIPTLVLEDGYFVCVKKSVFQHPEILTALLADGASFEKDVGKISCLRGVTLPLEIPHSPNFITAGCDGFSTSPGKWMSSCPVLYGAQGLVDDQHSLTGALEEYLLSTDDIISSAKEAQTEIKNSGNNNRCTHISYIKPCLSLSEEDVDALFQLFPKIEKSERTNYVIYMINSMHGAASAGLGEVFASIDQTFTTDLMQTLIPHCHHIEDRRGVTDMKALLVPYYSKYGAAKGNFKDKKGWMDLIGSVAAQAISDFYSLGEIVTLPPITFMSEICASHVFQLFPGAMDGTTDRVLLLELYRAILLNTPGKATTSSETMEPRKYKLFVHNDSSKQTIDLTNIISVATVYSAKPKQVSLPKYEPRFLHAQSILEQFQSRYDSSDSKIRLAMEIVDTTRAYLPIMYMDPASAVHMIDYEHVNPHKTEERSTLKTYAEKTYWRPKQSIERADPLLRMWTASAGDIVLYTALIRQIEREYWACKDADVDNNTPQYCKCESENWCVHRLLTNWQAYSRMKNDANKEFTPGNPSAAKGMQARSSIKRQADRTPKAPEKTPHDSMYMGTVRVTSSMDMYISPLGNAMLIPTDSAATRPYDADNDKADSRNKKCVSAIVNRILKSISCGLEEDYTSDYEHMAPSHAACKTTMANMSKKKLYNVLFATSPHVSLDQKENPVWNIGQRSPTYVTKRGAQNKKSAKHEAKLVIKHAMDKLIGIIISILNAARTACMDIKKQSPPLVMDTKWKSLLRCDPNINQYDCMTMPLFTATMVNILRPTVASQKMAGTLFHQAGLMQKFPFYERAKLRDVFEEGGTIQYGMAGDIREVDAKMSLFVHSSLPRPVPCTWGGSSSQHLFIDLFRIKATVKWDEKSSKAKTDATELNDEPDQAEFAESVVSNLKNLLSSDFVFETEDDDEMAYTHGLHDLLPTTKHLKPKSPVSAWLYSQLSSAIGKSVHYSDAANVIREIAEISQSYPKWKYVCSVVDLMCHTYLPTDMFQGSIYMGCAGLPMIKYALVYASVMRAFNAQTFNSKPIYTMCGYLGKCVKNVGRKTHVIPNYDMLSSLDAPYITTPMDYTMYSNSSKNSQKIFGGPVMKRAGLRDTVLIRIQDTTKMFGNRFNAPYFVHITPCVYSPNTGDANTQGRTLLQDMSHGELIQQLISQPTKFSPLVAVEAGYADLTEATNDSITNLAARIESSLQMDSHEAEVIAKLMMPTTTETDPELTWSDDDVELCEDQHMPTSTGIDDFIDNY